MSETTINVHIPRGALKKAKRALVSLLISTSTALMIVMMCFIGSDDSNGSVPGPVFFELMGWAVLSLAAAVALLAWMPDR
jgi:hypothetical protein